MELGYFAAWDAASLWLAVQTPATLLAIGLLTGVIACLVIGLLIERFREFGNLRCALGFHDDDHVQCMDAWHCWACGRKTPPHMKRFLTQSDLRRILPREPAQ